MRKRDQGVLGLRIEHVRSFLEVASVLVGFKLEWGWICWEERSCLRVRHSVLQLGSLLECLGRQRQGQPLWLLGGEEFWNRRVLSWLQPAQPKDRRVVQLPKQGTRRHPASACSRVLRRIGLVIPIGWEALVQLGKQYRAHSGKGWAFPNWGH